MSPIVYVKKFTGIAKSTRMNDCLVRGFFLTHLKNVLVKLDPSSPNIWVFPKIRGVSPKMDGLEWKTLLKMADLGVPLFSETSI